MARYYVIGLLWVALVAMGLATTTGAEAAGYLAVVTASSGGSVQVYDPASGAPVDDTSMTGLGGTEFVSFGGDGNLYVNRYQDPPGSGWDVARFATGTWTPLEEFASLVDMGYPVERQCTSAKWGPDGSLYMAKVQGYIYKSDTAGAIPTGVAFGLGGDARGMTIGPDGILYMCSAGNSKIGRFSLGSGAMLADIPLTAGPHGVSIGPKHGGGAGYDLYVTYWGQPVIDIYDSSTGAKVGVFDSLANYGLGSSICLSVVFSKDGTTAYFTDWSDGIIFRKVGAAPATQFVTGLSRPRGVDLSEAYSPADTTDYMAVVTGASGGSLVVCNPATGAVINSTSMTNLGALEFANFGEDGYLYANRYLQPEEFGWDVARFRTGLWGPLEEFATFNYEPPYHRITGVKCWSDGNVYIAKVNGVYYKSNLAGSEPIGGWGGLGGDGRGLTIGIDGTLYYASAGASHIAAVNMPSSTRLPDITTTFGPHCVSIGPKHDGGTGYDLYVTYWGQPVIDIYDPATGAKVGVFDSLANYGFGSSFCLGVAFSDDGSTAYFTDWQDGIVFKKVGSAPATQLVTGLTHPRTVALRTEYRGTKPSGSAIVDVKKMPTESLVTVTDKIVTAIFDVDFFYIEDPDRQSGIRCYKHVDGITYTGVQVGDRVDVSGVVRNLTLDGSYYTGERFIFAQTGSVAVVQSPGTPLEPLFMTNKALGGGDLGVAPDYQQGVANGVGLNNIGLFIKTTGKVSQVDTSFTPATFVVDDGSGVLTVAIMAMGGTPPENGDDVQITGISSCFKNFENLLDRNILVTDWQKVNP